RVDTSQPGRIRIAGDRGDAGVLSLGSGILARLWFRPVGSGATQVTLERVELVSGPGRTPAVVTPSSGVSLNEQVQVWLAEPKTVEP
ncbi:MAG TPA: hypothetical protein VIL08_08365, partial [Limnochorda sp.]